MNSRIHDLHLQFVTKSAPSSPENGKTKTVCSGANRNDASSSQRTTPRKVSELDTILGDRIYKVKVPDSKKLVAVLKEHNPLVLQRHLLNSIVHNQVSYIISW